MSLVFRWEDAYVRTMWLKCDISDLGLTREGLQAQTLDELVC